MGFDIFFTSGHIRLENILYILVRFVKLNNALYYFLERLRDFDKNSYGLFTFLGNSNQILQS